MRTELELASLFKTTYAFIFLEGGDKKADLHRVIKGRALVVVAYMFLEQACFEFILHLTRGMASTGDSAGRKGGGEIHLREK